MKRVLCQYCQFWEAIHAGSCTKSKEGRCWRNAPAPHDRPEHTATQWSATFDNDWCGDGLLQVDKPLAAKRLALIKCHKQIKQMVNETIGDVLFGECGILFAYNKAY